MKRNVLGLFIILTIIFPSCYNNTKTPKIDFEQNKKSFENSIKTLVGVNEKINELEINFAQKPPTEESFNEFLKEYGECINQMKIGINESENVTDEYLNYLHPDLKQMFKKTYIASNILWLLSQKKLLKKILINQPNRFGNLIESFDFNKFKIKMHNADVDSLTSKQIDDSLFSGKLGEYLESEAATSRKIDSLNSIWWSFVKTNQELLNDNDLLSGKKKFNKSYWKMLLYLGIGAFIAAFLFVRLAVFATILIVGLTKEAVKDRYGSTGKLILITPLFIISIGLQFYFWVLWASFCAFNVFYFMGSPLVTYKWLYYLTGFIALSPPLSYIAYRENGMEDYSKNEIKGAGIYFLISTAAYLLFCIFPKLLDYKFISFINDWLSSS